MEYRPYHLAAAWSQLGHRVTIIGASFSHLRHRQPAATGGISREVIDGIRYWWLRTPAYHGNGVRRAINMAAFVQGLLRHGSKLAREIVPDAVIASSTYPLDMYPARRIARQAGANLIFEVHDLWPLSPMELDGMPPWHPFIFVMQRAENYAYRHADTVVSLLPKAESHMREHGLAPGKFVYIPNGVDLAAWESAGSALPEIHDRILAGLKANGTFTVGYAGGHGLSNALENFIAAASLIEGEPACLVLVGQGPEKERLERTVRERGLANVVFLPPVPKDAIPALLARMDALYLGWQRKRLYRYGINPNKLFDYMMSAKPVIHAVEAGNDPVAESGCGISLPPENPEAVAGAILELMRTDPEERQALGKRGRDYVVANHDYRVLAGQFLDIMR